MNSDANASNKTYLKEIQEKRKEETFCLRKMKKEIEKIKIKQRNEQNKKDKKKRKEKKIKKIQKNEEKKRSTNEEK